MYSTNKTMSTRRLHRHEMKKLVHILRNFPKTSASQESIDTYQKNTKKDIKVLPRRLRGSLMSTMSTSNGLCTRTHNGLNRHLISDLWSWIHHEIDSAIGKFLYPIIASETLSASRELKIRRLEPVLQMFRKDFDIKKSAPPGRAPIACGDQWQFQSNSCPGCMLARIGSDEAVLYILYAGLVGRLSRQKLFRSNAPLGDLNVDHLDSVRSKRVRFVRSWIKAAPDGDVLLREAGEMGLLLKKSYKTLIKSSTTEVSSIYRSSRRGFGKPSSPNNPFGDHAVVPEQDYASTRRADRPTVTDGIQTQYAPKEWSPTSPDPKLGPTPRPRDIDSHSPIEALGFNVQRRHQGGVKPDSVPSLISNDDSDGASTICPDDSISMAPFRTTEKPHPKIRHKPVPESVHRHPASLSNVNIPRHANSVRKAPSIAPSVGVTSTILSYDGGDHPAGPSKLRGYDPLATPEEIQKYKTMLANFSETAKDQCFYGLPSPQRESMYFGYNDKNATDPFADADIEGEEDEEVVMDGDVGGEDASQSRRLSEASTEWGNMY